MTCKHENRDHLKPGDFYNDAADAVFGPYEAECEQLRCLDCGAWLSLGPSNDDDPRVAIEVRAAEIAVRYDEGHDDRSTMEWAGWVTVRDCDSCTSAYAEAGYLARYIHDTTELAVEAVARAVKAVGK